MNSLKDLVEAGKQLSGGGGSGIISRVKVEFGFHQYVREHDFWSFWKPTSSQSELAGVKDELVGRLKKAGCNDTPNFGVKITVDKNVLSRDEPYKSDLQEFTPSWQDGAFGMILESIETAKLPVGEWFYGRVEYKANPFFVKKGEAGKTDTDQDGNPRYPSIRIPTERFTDESTAKEAVVDTGSGGGSADNVSYDALSDKAKSQFNDANSFLAQASQIQEWYNKALKGEEIPSKPIKDYLSPKDGSISEGSAKLYIADVWGWEASDVDLLLNEIPF